MPNVRLEHKNKTFWISKNALRHAIAYCLMYPEWESEYSDLLSLKAVNYDGMPKGSGDGSGIENAAIRAAELSDKMYLVDLMVKRADPEISDWLKFAVTHEGVTFSDLEARGIPCGGSKYYRARRKFYYLISKKI